MSDTPAIDDALIARIGRLAAGQRLLLARRLGAFPESSASADAPVAPPRLPPPRLIAFVVAREGMLDTDALREFAGARLPDYMVPQNIVPIDEVPRTPAGKIDRAALRARNWSGAPTLEKALQGPRTEAETIIARIWAEVLGLDEVGVDEDFFELGGDSLLSIRILARASREGLKINPEKFFAHPTVAGQAAVAAPVSSVRSEQGLVTGPVPFLPIQHWFFERIPVDAGHWNQSILLATNRPIERETIERAVQKLLLHHDALRARFTRDESGWQQRIVDLDPNLPVHFVDLREHDERGRTVTIERLVTRLSENIDLEKGTPFRIAMIATEGARVDKLLIVAHHLVVDAFSWQLLIEDLQSATVSLSEGKSATLPPKTTSLKQWAARLVEFARSDAIRAEVEFWTRANDPGDAELPLDMDVRESNLAGSARTLTVQLDAANTRRLLHEVPSAFHTQINDVLLAALLIAAGPWIGRQSLLIDLEGHGREAIFDDVDLSRTAGWLTTVFPVHLDARNHEDPIEVLKAVKTRLREIPNRGLGYGLLREHSPDSDVRAALRALPRPQLCFNFLGQSDRMTARSELFTIAAENVGVVRSPKGPRPYLLDIDARVSDGKLSVGLTYSAHAHREETIARLGRGYLDALEQLIARSGDPATSAAAPADFPLANLDRAKLEGISKLLDAIDDDDDD